MAYEQAAQPRAINDSLLSGYAHLNDRFREILLRVAKIGDTLHGPVPRDAMSGGSAEKSPAPTIRRFLDSAANTALDIENELTRIEANL